MWRSFAMEFSIPHMVCSASVGDIVKDCSSSNSYHWGINVGEMLKKHTTVGLLLALAACQEEPEAFDRPVYNQDRSTPIETAGSAFTPPEVESYSARAIDAEARSRDRHALIQARLNDTMPGIATSVDPIRSAPSFLVTGRNAVHPSNRTTRANVAASDYLYRYRNAYGLTEASVNSARVTQVHESPRGGRIVQFDQVVNGHEVYGIRTKVLLSANLDLLAISGNLERVHEQNEAVWAQEPATALATVLSDLVGRQIAPDTVIAVRREPEGHAIRFASADEAPFRFPQLARVREVYYPLHGRLLPAYAVSIEVAGVGERQSRAYEYLVSADDGALFERQNQTFADVRQYRVWADVASKGYRPSDGPHGDISPHPTGAPEDHVKIVGNGSRRRIANVDGLNTNPEGGTDPWLPSKAKTLLEGNNVQAYADHFGDDGFSEAEGDVTVQCRPNGVFEANWFPEDGAFETTDQVESAIIQLFFVNNWLHDWYYDSGFTEAAGNAQLDNYGRGGSDGDPLHVEAQDTRGVNRNNANMSTPFDGLSPRMQMYVWDGEITPIGETVFSVASPASIAGSYEVQASTFGVDDLVNAAGAMVIADDATGTATDGCEPIVNDIAGRIALIDRGSCTFISKAIQAATAGATAVVVMNNDPDNPDVLPPMGGSDPSIEIPVVGVSYATGQRLRTALETSDVVGEVSRAGRIRGADVDGTVDNAIVAHEWGHYLHHRLVSFCSSAQCAAISEGWGDFVALHMMLREQDDLHGAFPVATWATQNPYFAIRRAPYSIESSFNALTFGHIADGATLPTDHPIEIFGPNSEIHNAGEIWASAMFDAYVGLIESPHLTFEEARRRMSDYVVEGLMLTPLNSDFIEQRDAILAAVAASDETDLAIFAQAFAGRGMGTGAIAPSSSSTTFEDVQESFALVGDLQLLDSTLTLTDDCDGDGNLDAGETAEITLSLLNAAPVPVTSTQISVGNPDGLLEDNTVTTTIDHIGPYASATATVSITLDESLTAIETLELNLIAASDSSLTPSVSTQRFEQVNFDDIPESSAIDDVESSLVTWTLVDLSPTIGFRRTPVGEGTVWHADDPGEEGDQFLISPPLWVGDEPFIVTADHRYSFETEERMYWDGAVIEYSTDGGASWADVSDYVDPGYRGTLESVTDNPLGDRRAFVSTSPGYPAFSPLELDFGTVFAGQEVFLRFRVGSDILFGDDGWDLDNIGFSGITNLPFATLTNDAGICEP